MVVWRKRKIGEMVVWNGNEKEKASEREKMKRKKRNDPREGELRREWDPYGERLKSLPWKDFKWGVYLGTNAYPSIKALEQ